METEEWDIHTEPVEMKPVGPCGSRDFVFSLDFGHEIFRIKGVDGRLYDGEGRDLFARFINHEGISAKAIAAYENYLSQDESEEPGNEGVRIINRLILLDLLAEVQRLRER